MAGQRGLRYTFATSTARGKPPPSSGDSQELGEAERSPSAGLYDEKCGSECKITAKGKRKRITAVNTSLRNSADHVLFHSIE